MRPPKTPPTTAPTAAPGGPATLLPTAMPCRAPPAIPCAWAHSGSASAPARMPAINVFMYTDPSPISFDGSASQTRAAQERLERGHCVAARSRVRPARGPPSGADRARLGEQGEAAHLHQTKNEEALTACRRPQFDQVRFGS